MPNTVRIEPRPFLSWPCALLALTLVLQGCGGSGDGPATPKWDRDSCERCRMVLSDPHYAAQVRYLPEGKKQPRILWFDDVGCASLWLEDKPWKDAATTRIWVTDHRTGQWIDARSAHYVQMNNTPMAYGLGAQIEPAPDSLDYAGAVAHIHKVEASNNLRSQDLIERFKQQAFERSHQHSPTESKPQ